MLRELSAQEMRGLLEKGLKVLEVEGLVGGVFDKSYLGYTKRDVGGRSRYFFVKVL